MICLANHASAGVLFRERMLIFPYFLRQLISCGQIDLVPFLASKGNIGCLTGILYPVWVGSAKDGLHVGRMAQEPGNCNRSIRHALDCCERVDFLVEFEELRVIQEDTFKEAILEWRPGLNSNIIQTAVIQNA